MKHPPFSDKPPAGDLLLFLFVAVVSCTITYFVNVHYGLVEQRQYALDLARSILTDPHDSSFSPSHLESVLHVHEDVKELSFCHAGSCQTVKNSQFDRGHCGTGPFPNLLCVVATDKTDDSKSVSVKVHPDATYHDAYRDVAVVLFAQVLGMMAWYGVTRRSRRRLRQAGEALQKAAAQDFLTGLANRSTMDVAINQALEQKLTNSWLLYLDLDDFKLINDAHGHEVGDSVLRSVARRLTLDSPDDFLVARMGGDEFAILLTNKPLVAVEIVLEELMSSMGHPIEVDGRNFSTSISIGVSSLTNDACTLTEAKRRADIALYESKRLGKSHASFFDEAIDKRQQFEYQLIQDFQGAVYTPQVYFLYQPIVSKDGELCGLEALARWNHPSLGLVSPGAFVPLAERAGLTLELGAKAIAEACRDLAVIRKLGLGIEFMSINVSAQQLTSDELLENLIFHLSANGLAPKDLTLEITESLAMADEISGNQRLNDLAAAGFLIAIDDFGTGYSSLARLQALPIKKLKIDRAFVGMMETHGGAILVETMLELGRKLGMSCVAEGVETQTQRDALAASGCEMFQGFWYGQAMAPTELIGWAAERDAVSKKAESSTNDQFGE